VSAQAEPAKTEDVSASAADDKEDTK
jgi:hypothetical protein